MENRIERDGEVDSWKEAMLDYNSALKQIETKLATNIDDLLTSQPIIHITFLPQDAMFAICITRRELLLFPSDLIAETSMSSIYSNQTIETTRAISPAQGRATVASVAANAAIKSP